MPTGYTAGVQDGTVTEFTDFAMVCARNFGACIMMRDEPLVAEIADKFQPSDYHVKALVSAEDGLLQLKSMELSDITAANDKQHRDRCVSNAGMRKKKQLEESRYESMLAEVQAWEPPSPDHENMKEWMKLQLTDSIKFDCSGDYYDEPIRQEDIIWHEQQIDASRREIAYHKKHYAEEVDRVTSRNRWIRQLRESLRSQN